MILLYYCLLIILFLNGVFIDDLQLGVENIFCALYISLYRMNMINKTLQ